MERATTLDRALNGYAGIALTAGVLALVSFFFVRLGPFLLDWLIAINIAISVIMLLVTFFVTNPLQISAFPTVILLTTLFRLALNVGTTRSILLEGDAGEIVRAFGEFVVGSDYVVGAAIFLALIVIQFVVIAKGGERVAEVSARFTLDAMPGKQAAIDFDLNGGSITKEEAKRRRRMIEKESKFYGATDGAMKFVKGDAIAGLVLCLINFAFGLVVGITRDGLSAGDAAQIYTTLTIGDGLQAQIPSLLMSLAAGVLVTRVASDDDRESDLGRDVLGQLLVSSKVFLMAAVFCFFLGVSDRVLGTGMPEVPFYALAAIAGMASYGLWGKDGNRIVDDARKSATEEEDRERATTAVAPLGVTLELGALLSDLTRKKPDQDAPFATTLLARVLGNIELDLGIEFPSGAAYLEPALPDPRGWRIKIWGVPVASDRLDLKHAFVAAEPDAVRSEFPGAMAIRQPITGARGALVAVPDFVAKSGTTRLEAKLGPAIMEDAIDRTVRRHARKFLGIQETDALLDRLRATHEDLVEAVVPARLSHQELADVLGELLDDGLSIRDLRSILEALARVPLEPRNVALFAEFVRGQLGEAISLRRVDANGVLHVIQLDPDFENTLLDDASRRHYIADDERRSLLGCVENALRISLRTPDRLVVLVQTAQLRPVVASELRRVFPDLLVIPASWIPPFVPIEPIAPRANLQEVATEPAPI